MIMQRGGLRFLGKALSVAAAAVAAPSRAPSHPGDRTAFHIRRQAEAELALRVFCSSNRRLGETRASVSVSSGSSFLLSSFSYLLSPRSKPTA